MSLYKRLKFHLRRSRFDMDLAAEMRDHLEEKIAEYTAGGMTEEEARFAARRAFGNVTLLQEVSRDRWRFRFLDERLRDLRYAFRMLRRNPSFTLVVVLSLALGIGANTAIFTVINGLMLRPLPVLHPYQLANIKFDWPDGHTGITFNYPLYRAVRDRVKSFSGVIASGQAYLHRLRLGAHEGAGLAQTQLVSGNYFSVLGVPPALGRTLVETDDQSSAPAVAVLSFEAWQKRFAMDPGVIGRTVQLDEAPITIVGVAAKGFRGVQVGANPEFWLALHQLGRFDPEMGRWIESGDMWWFFVLARVSPSSKWSQAGAECAVVVHQQLLDDMRRNPRTDERDRARTSNLHTLLAPGFAGSSWQVLDWSKPVFLLFAAVGLLLLIACANVASLLLARAAARRHEIAVRLSLGASRRRLVSQLLTESTLLALIGGLIGLALAHPAASFLMRFVQDRTFQPSTTPDVRVLLFTLAVSLISGIVFGIAPALRATRVNIGSDVRETSASVTANRHALVLDKSLIAAQVGLSLLLVMAAGLLIRTVQKLRATKMGFNPSHVLVFDSSISNRYSPEQKVAALKELLRGIDRFPGVEASGTSSFNLLSGGGIDWAITVPGYKPLNENDRLCDVLFVGGNFFKSMGIPLLAGRPFDARDSQPMKNPAFKGDASHPEQEGDFETPYVPRVAIINEEMARHYFQSINVTGRQIRTPFNQKAPPIEIIGVVGNTKYVDLRENYPRTVFLPGFQVPVAELVPGTFEVRTAVSPESIIPAIQTIFNQSGVDAQATNFRTMDEVIAGSIAQERLLASLSGFFGAFALLLTAIGLYGIVAYSVVRRTQEIGVRMALGATARNVAGMMLREIALVTAIGIAAGLPVSQLGARLLATRLFELRPSDPVLLITAILVMLAVALAAAVVPTLRASRIEPMQAIRYE